MYTEFLKGLAELSEKLNEAAKLGGNNEDLLPVPYLAGQVEVHLDGELVGHFVFEETWVNYEPTKDEFEEKS